MVNNADSSTAAENPRKPLDDAVDYAVAVANDYIHRFKQHDIVTDGLNYLELGPGSDFAPQLVLASLRVNVTLADSYLADWDETYHPHFYRAFLKKWDGPREAVIVALDQGGYAGLLKLEKESTESLKSLPSAAFSFVQSNAVLEHVPNIRKAIQELARVTAVGGIHAHQVDFRDHKNFDRPLDHLLMTQEAYESHRAATNAIQGTALRMPELAEMFAEYFWLWKIEMNTLAPVNYAEEIRQRLTSTSPYKQWPVQLLREVGGRLYAVRKPSSPRKRWFSWCSSAN